MLCGYGFIPITPPYFHPYCLGPIRLYIIFNASILTRGKGRQDMPKKETTQSPSDSVFDCTIGPRSSVIVDGETIIIDCIEEKPPESPAVHIDVFV
jgi:hypothetical protein